MIKIAKATFNKYCWGMVGGLIGSALVDIYKKEPFELSDWVLRIVVFVVIYFIMGAIEYKSGKLK